MNKGSKLADKVLQGYKITEQEGLEILRSDNDEIWVLMDAAYKIREHYFGKIVKLEMIISTKDCNCSEIGGYCEQSFESTAEIESYSMMIKQQNIAGSKREHDL